MKRDVTSMAIIQEKAREIFEKLKRQTPSSSSDELEFKATTGWFARSLHATRDKSTTHLKRSHSHPRPPLHQDCLRPKTISTPCSRNNTIQFT
jgi:hypothetical protein